jgi:sec-independent protein translocase protein TatA
MGIGATELVLLVVAILILFGAGKLPTVMGDLAKGVRNFKAGLKDEPAPDGAPPPPQLPPPPAPPTAGSPPPTGAG